MLVYPLYNTSELERDIVSISTEQILWKWIGLVNAEGPIFRCVLNTSPCVMLLRFKSVVRFGLCVRCI